MNDYQHQGRAFIIEPLHSIGALLTALQHRMDFATLETDYRLPAKEHQDVESEDF
jgi:hypothetical protein